MHIKSFTCVSGTPCVRQMFGIKALQLGNRYCMAALTGTLVIYTPNLLFAHPDLDFFIRFSASTDLKMSCERLLYFHAGTIILKLFMRGQFFLCRHNKILELNAH